MISNIIEVGNSLYLLIPKIVVVEYNLKEGDNLEVKHIKKLNTKDYMCRACGNTFSSSEKDECLYCSNCGADNYDSEEDLIVEVKE